MNSNKPTFYEPINPRLQLIFFGLGLMTILVVVIWYSPQILATYYQVKGGQILERTLEAVGYSDTMVDVCSSPAIGDEEHLANAYEAISDLERAINFDSRDSQPYLLLGRAYCLVGENEAAVENLLKYAELKPDNPLGHLRLGFAYEAIGNLPMAVDEWKLAGVTAKDFLESGEQSREAKLYPEALQWYGRAIQVDVNWAEPWYRIGLVFKEQGDWEKAISAYQEAAQRSPDDREIWYELGEARFARQEWDLALQTYERGLEASGSQVGLSNLYYRVGHIRQYSLMPRDFDGAWASYELALELDDYPVDRWMRADTYYQEGVLLARRGEWEQALSHYQEALGLNPKHYWAYLMSASGLWQLGKMGEAKDMAQLSVSLDPDKKNGYRLLGDFYSAEGDISKATAMYTKVLELDPKDEDAREALRGLGGESP